MSSKSLKDFYGDLLGSIIVEPIIRPNFMNIELRVKTCLPALAIYYTLNVSVER